MSSVTFVVFIFFAILSNLNMLERISTTPEKFLRIFLLHFWNWKWFIPVFSYLQRPV